MYCLIDDLARRRAVYPPPVETVPGVLVIDVPPPHRGTGLLLGRYYPIVVESEAERLELERYLAAPRTPAVLPGLLDHRPSSLRTEQILVIRYDPPAKGWPWLSMCRWPAMAGRPEPDAREMARGCYTTEAFASAQCLEDHQAQILRALAKHRSVALRFVAGDQVIASGRG